VVRRRAPDAPPSYHELTALPVRLLVLRDRGRAGGGLLLVFCRLDARGRIQLALPERLGWRWAGCRRGRGSRAFHQCVEVGASHSDAPADPQGRQGSLVYPVFHGVLVQLEDLGDLGDCEKLIAPPRSLDLCSAAAVTGHD